MNVREIAGCFRTQESFFSLLPFLLVLAIALCPGNARAQQPRCIPTFLNPNCCIPTVHWGCYGPPLPNPQGQPTPASQQPSPASSWLTSGNAGTTAGSNFLGTTDNQPLELHVNNTRALRLEPTRRDDHAGRDRGAGRDPADLDHDPLHLLAAAGPAGLLGRRPAPGDRGAARRLLLQRLV